MLQLDEVLQVCGHSALPLLTLRDFASLASCSTGLRDLTYRHSASWTAAAQVDLCPMSPQIVSKLAVVGMQALMRRRAAAAKALSAGSAEPLSSVSVVCEVSQAEFLDCCGSVAWV